MSLDTTKYFLLALDKSTGELQVEEFGDRGELAMTEYGRRERAYANRPEIEVVLLGADLLKTLKTTHSHYFHRSTESLLAGLEERLPAA